MTGTNPGSRGQPLLFADTSPTFFQNARMQFALRFATEAGEWQDEWDSSLIVESSALPVAAEIEIGLVEFDLVALDFDDAVEDWRAAPIRCIRRQGQDERKQKCRNSFHAVESNSASARRHTRSVTTLVAAPPSMTPTLLVPRRRPFSIARDRPRQHGRTNRPQAAAGGP